MTKKKKNIRAFVFGENEILKPDQIIGGYVGSNTGYDAFWGNCTGSGGGQFNPPGSTTSKCGLTHTENCNPFTQPHNCSGGTQTSVAMCGPSGGGGSTGGGSTGGGSTGGGGDNETSTTYCDIPIITP